MSELRKLSQVYSWRSVERKLWTLCGTSVLCAQIWFTGGGVAGRRGAEFWRFCTRSRGSFLKMFDANVELECRCVSLFAEGATSTLAEMFSIEISQAPWNFLDRDAYCEFRAPYHKRARQLCPGSSQKRAQILISTFTPGILWSFIDFIFVRFLWQRDHVLHGGRRVVSTTPDRVMHWYIYISVPLLYNESIFLFMRVVLYYEI